MYTQEQLPSGRATATIAQGIYVKFEKGIYYASKNAPHMNYFTEGIRDIKKGNKDSEKLQNVRQFDSAEGVLKFINPSKPKPKAPKRPKKFNKEKYLQNAINALPSDQKQVVVQTILEEPTLKIGVQKSLLQGFSDLPLFGGLEDKQTKLF